ncbi:DUF2243 domain-containing protein [Rathayibacter sp. VKM Ac-2856]|uniref:DUF2243 domain-containing protein n=1 Tax=unclassified Rathayibacter TaxID=2609250 RepID=UPI0015670AC6|nr:MULTISPECIES: DUF2243 domain-containing protein [unclassified Rathayibacter]NQX03658.1 DUF2243 domain-containing protein [Rathayibacter sp. VKM Ac-2858]NQX18826.1 DUF2243 domain-containing protein [Rathayibacter sp. VKM Ac-2856]
MTASRTPASRAVDPPERARGSRTGQNLWSGGLFGLGLAAFIDETVFHQLLHWHHFYDLGTTELGLVSDGIFHAVGWFAAIGALFLFADLRRRGALEPMRWIGAVLVGAGAFQLYDGTIQHKLLGLHQIRAVDDLLPYDLAWNIVAVVLILAGAVLLVRARRVAVRSGAGS